MHIAASSWTEGLAGRSKCIFHRRRSKPATDPKGPWLTVKQAAQRAQCGVKVIYREVEARRLKATRIGGRKDLRIKVEWLDEWLENGATFQ
jgi:excisionase family DNA binding protein